MLALRRAATVAATTIALVGGAALAESASAAPAVATASVGAEAPAIERALLREMNRVRARHGRALLRPARTLARPARAHSRYLVRHGLFQHEGPRGAPFWTRLTAAGFPRHRAVAENLAMASGCGTGVARQAVRMWMKSPGHRSNLLDPRFRWAGSGVAKDRGCASTIVTADYGS